MNASPALTAELLRARARSGTLWVPASGPSMGRRYPAGTRLRIAPSLPAPRFGEVWAFVDDESRLVVHRYVFRGGSGRWRFRGDAVLALDPPVPGPQLVGRVVEIDDGTRRRAPRVRDVVEPTGRLVVSAVADLARRALRRAARGLARNVKTVSSSRE